jgi:WD40 repeat protein
VRSKSLLSRSTVADVTVAFSSDAVYLYSTHDEPETDRVMRTPILSSNKRTKASKIPTPVAEAEPTPDILSMDVEMADDAVERSLWTAAEQLLGDDASELSDPEDEDEDSESGGEGPDLDIHSDVPIVLPRSRFLGHCNVETVKDGQFCSTTAMLSFEPELDSPVNFLGPNDEYVTSGSDDGNFFIWRKATGSLHGILEGDSSVVNVIESHPRLPLIAVSGIDTTVKVRSVLSSSLSILTSLKLFAPARGPSIFSRLDNIALITDRNAQAARRTSRGISMNLTLLLLQYHQIRRTLGANETEGETTEGPSQCTNQ